VSAKVTKRRENDRMSSVNTYEASNLVGQAVTPDEGTGVPSGEGRDIMKQLFICALLTMTAGCLAFPMGRQEEEAFSYQGIDQVEIKGEFLAVEVTADDGLSVSMASDLPEDSAFSPRSYRVKHEVIGSRLSVWVEKDPGTWAIGEGGRLLFTVPQGTDLDVKTVSGSARVDGLETTSLKVSSVSGSIALSSIRAPLLVSNVSGSVSIVGFDGTLSATTVSGAIECREIALAGDSALTSTSGAISVQFASPLEDYRFELSSVSGSLAVGSIMAQKGLRVGSGPVRILGATVSGAQNYR
jgi:hypothetical protein